MRPRTLAVVIVALLATLTTIGGYDVYSRGKLETARRACSEHFSVAALERCVAAEVTGDHEMLQAAISRQRGEEEFTKTYLGFLEAWLRCKRQYTKASDVERCYETRKGWPTLPS